MRFCWCSARCQDARNNFFSFESAFFAEIYNFILIGQRNFFQYDFFLKPFNTFWQEKFGLLRVLRISKIMPEHCLLCNLLWRMSLPPADTHRVPAQGVLDKLAALLVPRHPHGGGPGGPGRLAGEGNVPAFRHIPHFVRNICYGNATPAPYGLPSCFSNSQITQIKGFPDSVSNVFEMVRFFAFRPTISFAILNFLCPVRSLRSEICFLGQLAG